MFDPLVLHSKAITMQRIQLAVARGYVQWVGGSVSAARALALATKFDQLYALSATKHQRYRRKARGHANAMLFFYPQPSTTSLHWWLLRTQPDQREHWRDARDRAGRLTWGTEYELVRLNVPRQVRQKYQQVGRQINEHTWTWRLTAETYDAWRQRIRRAASMIQHDGSAWRQMEWSLDRAPGFRGVRAQVAVLRRYARLAHLKQVGQPFEWSSAPRWMQPRGCREYPLSLVVATVGQQDSWWPLRADRT